MITLTKRYAALAAEKLEAETDPKRKKELELMLKLSVGLWKILRRN
jgi:hypothetical protein